LRHPCSRMYGYFIYSHSENNLFKLNFSRIKTRSIPKIRSDRTLSSTIRFVFGRTRKIGSQLEKLAVTSSVNFKHYSGTELLCHGFVDSFTNKNILFVLICFHLLQSLIQHVD